ncbi:MAG: FmdE family protein [Actinomycetota bacterium]
MGYGDNINRLVSEGNLGALLEKSAEFHGHICSFSAYGVKAGCYAMGQIARQNEGMEEVMAIVETNNCFSDGIQVVTGCTFGNNALVFKDLGKTAVTVAGRKSGRAVRLALRKDYWDSRKEVYPRVFELFEKIVAKRKEAEPSERQEFFSLAEEMARKEMQVPEADMFDIRKQKIEVPGYAPIHDSVTCSICGESVMETRARIKEQEPACISCMGGAYFYMDGFGIGYKGGGS